MRSSEVRHQGGLVALDAPPSDVVLQARAGPYYYEDRFYSTPLPIRLNAFSTLDPASKASKPREVDGR